MASTIRKSENRNVLFLIPSLRRGGAETQLIDLVNNLPDSKFNKHLLCFDLDLDQKEKIDQDYVTFHHVPRRYAYDLYVAKKIAAVIDNNNVEVIHCSLQISLFFGWLAKSLSKNKPHLVVTLHTTKNRDIKADFFDKVLYQWLMRSCDKVICVCETQSEYWKKRFPFLRNKIDVVHNGVDVSYFEREQVRHESERLRERLGLKPTDKVICHIAGFRPEKGHEILLKAFSQLASRGSDLYIVFAGDGILRPTITELAARMGLKNRVRFLGSISDVRPLLGISSVSVIASTAVETFSIAMLESMAMQVPMVATDIGGTAEAVIPGETGFLVPVGDKDALAKALHVALEQEATLIKLRKGAREYVCCHFSTEVMATKTTQLLEELSKKQEPYAA